MAGDYSPNPGGTYHYEIEWMTRRLQPWVAETSKRFPIIAVAGNHDKLYEEKPEAVPQLDWTYLQDSGTEWNGLKIWGSPWQKRFFDWAFNASEEELAEKWALIPDDADILILHGPPFGIGDFSVYGNEHIGSPSLLKRIQEIKPKLVVFGHIHSGRGAYIMGNTVLANVAFMDDNYKPIHPPMVFSLDPETKIIRRVDEGKDNNLEILRNGVSWEN
jgi:Icc-related predicted phosphoesterase